MKRSHFAVPFALAIILSACGSDDAVEDENAATETSEAVDVEGAAEELSRIEIRPGQYESSAKLVNFEVPGLPEQFAEQVREELAKSLSQGNSFCVTSEEASQGPERMLQEMAESDCTFNRFDVSGGDVNADMQCTPSDGSPARVQMTGNIGAQGSTMRMETAQETPNGTVNLTVDLESRRVGDCG